MEQVTRILLDCFRNRFSFSQEKGESEKRPLLRSSVFDAFPLGSRLDI